MLKLATPRKRSGDGLGWAAAGACRLGFDRAGIHVPRRLGVSNQDTGARRRWTDLGRVLVSRAAGAPASRGKLVFPGGVLPCALGRTGPRRAKREGDGATPVGTWTPVAAFVRRDRMRPPRCRLSTRAIHPIDGWCDDPGSRLYNRPVTLPCRPGHETMWRADRLYDAVVVLDHNLRTPRRGHGSAVFFHVAGPGFAPTAGCIAIEPEAMRRLLPRLGPRTRFVVLG